MSGSIEFSGFDDLEGLIQDMTLTEQDKSKAMRAALKPVYEETQKNTPVRSEKLKESEIMQVKKEGFATVGIVRYGVFWDFMNEFGNSKNKKHVGFFERSVNKSTNEALNILANELLDKVK